MLQRVPASAGADAILAAYQRDGIVIIENFFSSDVLQRFVNEVEPSLNAIELPSPSAESDVIADLAGEKTKRLGQLVTESKIFRHELLEHDLMHTLVEKVFVEGPMDGYWMNASEVIEINPGSKAQVIHRDQELYPAWDRAGPAMPEAICTFITAITPFTAENGATQVAPGTHRTEWKGHLMDADFRGRAEVETVPVVMNPGDCAFFSGKIIHGGGANHTADEARRALAMSFVRRILTPEQAHSLSITRDIADSLTYRAQAMLGFRSMWPVVKEGIPNFYWSHQGADVGAHIGLTEKAVGVV